MSLEIRYKSFNSTIEKSICGGCMALAESTGAFESAVVIVKPSSETHIVTGYGDSTYLERVSLPTNLAFAVERDSVIHLNVPILVEHYAHSGRLAEVEFYADSLGHELVPLTY